LHWRKAQEWDCSKSEPISTAGVAVIVGGGGGLGRACALDLARCGVRLALCDRDQDKLQETATMIADAGGQATTASFDARNPDALSGFLVQVDSAYPGRLDVLVNVVGGTFRQASSTRILAGGTR
jgi:citronellol/citronellal dehydrogenase